MNYPPGYSTAYIDYLYAGTYDQSLSTETYNLYSIWYNLVILLICILSSFCFLKLIQRLTRNEQKYLIILFYGNVNKVWYKEIMSFNKKTK